jgi:hypothetical protein
MNLDAFKKITKTTNDGCGSQELHSFTDIAGAIGQVHIYRQFV